MSQFEVSAVLHQYYKHYKDSWEQTRLVCFHSIAPYSKNLKLQDVLKFSWDVEQPEEKVNVEDIERRKQELIDFANSNNQQEYRP